MLHTPVIALETMLVKMEQGSTIKHIKEALAEIKKTARTDKVLGAEGAVIFLEKVSGC